MADFVPVPVVEGEPVDEWAEAHQQAVEDAFGSVAKVVDIDAGQAPAGEGLEIVREGEDVTFYLNGEEL